MRNFDSSSECSQHCLPYRLDGLSLGPAHQAKLSSAKKNENSCRRELSDQLHRFSIVFCRLSMSPPIYSHLFMANN